MPKLRLQMYELIHFCQVVTSQPLLCISNIMQVYISSLLFLLMFYSQVVPHHSRLRQRIINFSVRRSTFLFLIMLTQYIPTKISSHHSLCTVRRYILWLISNPSLHFSYPFFVRLFAAGWQGC